MSVALDAVTLALVGAGVLFGLLAAVGVLRLPDAYTRMQAASKASTLGAIALLAAAAAHFGDLATALRCAATVVFLGLTAPLAAQLLTRAAYRAGVPLEDEAVLDELATSEDP